MPSPRMLGRPLFTLLLSLAAVNVKFRFQNSNEAAVYIMFNERTRRGVTFQSAVSKMASLVSHRGPSLKSITRVTHGRGLTGSVAALPL